MEPLTRSGFRRERLGTVGFSSKPTMRQSLSVSMTPKRRPAEADVTVQAEGFVLRQDKDAAEIAVDAIGERDVDDSIYPAEGDRRLGAVARERPEALALPSGEEYPDGNAHIGHGWPPGARDRGSRSFYQQVQPRGTIGKATRTPGRRPVTRLVGVVYRKTNC